VIDSRLQDFRQRQSDYGPLCCFVFLNNRRLSEVYGDQGVTADEPRPFATITFADQNIRDIDTRGDQVRQAFEPLDGRALGLNDDRRRRGGWKETGQDEDRHSGSGQQDQQQNNRGSHGGWFSLNYFMSALLPLSAGCTAVVLV
jgi:hypothetical protein